MEEFITIKQDVQTQMIEKKSKFIAYLFYVESVEEADKIIERKKKEHFDARHNCTAYRVVCDNQIVEKSNDDGEPSGTAGIPMLNILQKNQLVNVLVVVTRYFGGILLGTGGLVRAYSGSVKKAIESSEKIIKCLGNEMEITLDYTTFENFKYYCKKNNINILNIEYKQDIVCKIEIESNKKAKFLSDFKTKTLFLKDIKELNIKYITKSIKK